VTRVGDCAAGETAAAVAAAVRDAMELAGWRDAIPEGAAVALKPNLCWDLPLPGAQTSPWVLDAVIEVLRERTDDIVVVEADQVTVDGTLALETTGLGRVLKARGVPFVNMSAGAFEPAHLDDGYVLHHIDVPEVLRDRLLVTLPVLKTHATTTITGALKNQWGCLKTLRHNYHLVVDEAIADLNDVVRPTFAVMDGTVAMEGNGPKTGTPRVTDLVLASADPVALDTIAATVMGFDPSAIGHVRLAAARGVGTTDRAEIDVAGLDVDVLDLHFVPPKLSFMVRTEFALRRSPLKKLMFDTPILSILGFAAKIWNGWWWRSVGRPARERIIRESRYGAQWAEHDDR
jgi:uncharacterized protein (DUF362 family)